MQALVDGFYIRNKLRRNNATVKQLDKLMSGVSITEASIRTWLTLDKILIDSNTPQEAKVGAWFEEILNDAGRSFPMDEFEQEKSSSKSKSTSKQKKEKFVEFFTKLMFFWSGLRKLNATSTYQVVFIDGAMPRASTCFYQLKLPKGVANKETLYRKLVTAVYNVEAGVGLYGGGTKQTKTAGKSSKRLWQKI